MNRKKKQSLRENPAYTIHNEVSLVKGGHEYFTLLLKLIRTSKISIHFHVYIYDDDETGTEVADALLEAAGRGVDVYLLIDGYASRPMSDSFRQRLLDGGVHFRMFEPIFQTSHFYFGRRLHHKIVVVDSFHSLVGGINISNKYNDYDGQPAWLDWALYARGEVAMELLKVQAKFWTKSRTKARRILTAEQIPLTLPHRCNVRMRRNDWVQNKTQITASYFEMFRTAKSHITIMSSYFIPGLLFQKRLARACKRGVQVKLILAGISDIRLTKHAERYVYGWLFRHNIRVFEYQKSVLHGKLATYDNEWATIGSYNVNNISAFASVELNLDVQDPDFASKLQRRLDEIIEKDCVEVTEAHYESKFSFPHRVVQWLSYSIVRVLFYLFTFYWRQEKG